MENREISKALSAAAKLMELHGENDFRVRAMQNAAFSIGRMEIPLRNLSRDQLEQMRGIGKSLGNKISQLITTGRMDEMESYLAKTPAGIVELMNLKGIGPKKLGVLWKDLGVETPGELLYACNENRLVELKGFGIKTQEQIRKAIEFSVAGKGWYHFAAVEKTAHQMLEAFSSFSFKSLTGEMRRKNELISSIDIIASGGVLNSAFEKIASLPFEPVVKFSQNEKMQWQASCNGMRINVFITGEQDFYRELFLTTASASHLEKLQEFPAYSKIKTGSFNSEEQIYSMLGLQFIEPELREGLEEIDLSRTNSLPRLIEFSDLKGILHNHSTYSDGMNSLRDMALQCKSMGYEYFGICDHSKSAFYANGLQEDRVLEQHAEIDQLNIELAPFRIFKGIESDILNDGSLDYPDPFLRKFDFVVASVHSGLKMTAQKATERIIRAVSHPSTTILGHPTGRLLLARQGYPVDHKAVIDACAENNVIIELNAHPYRLDLDWRWIQYALSKNVRISINPDAHHIGALGDMYYGTCVARKGMLTREMTFNALSRDEIESWFEARKKALVIH